MIGNEKLETAEELTFLGQAIIVNQVHEKEIRRIRMSWSAFGKHINNMISILPLSKENGVLLTLTNGSELGLSPWSYRKN